MADTKTEKDQLGELENLYNEKKITEFLETVDQALTDFPDSFQIKYLYAKVLKELRRFGEAEEALSKLIEKYPDNINLLTETADLYFDTGKYQEATDHYQKILFLDSFNSAAKESLKKIAEIINKSEQVPEEIDIRTEDFSLELDEKKPEIVPEEKTTDTDNKVVEEEPEKQADNQVDFITESAAELYVSQGLYDEALWIYEKLYEQGKDDRFLKIIMDIKLKKKGMKKIKALENFLKLIRKKGEEVV